MLNIYELEKRWFKYKTKSLVPTVSLILILFIVIVVLFLNTDLKKLDILSTSILKGTSFNTQKEEKSIPLEKPQEIINYETQEIKKIPETQIVSAPPTVEKESPLETKTTVLEPSLNFMKKMQIEPDLQYHEKAQEKLSTHNTKKEESVHKKSTLATTQQKVEKVEKKIQKKITEDINVIKIKKQNSYEDIDYVLKRFKKNNNPALSLFIAKKYYELGDYKQAYNYALITNKINNSIEASWIIFSKSLVKLKQKNKAIKTLQQYINHSSSNQARLLLEDILSGKFQ